MDKSQLKQRLVGAIVLVALGVIFIPIILDRDDEFAISGSNIPARPEALQQLAERTPPPTAPLPASPQLEAEPVDELSPVPAVSQTPEKEPAATEKAEKVATPVPDEKSATQSENSRAWVVQVASFAERDKALKLRDRLRKAKYPTFVESVSAKSGSTLYRVRVGPVVQRNHADGWKKKIAKDFKLSDALVMAHP